jgi:uncharacterized repeat protein (TIGR01451 family)
MTRRHRISRRLIATVILIVGVALAVSSNAVAATISSAGPLTDITISPDLNCAVNHTGDSSGEWYGGTACGTLAVDLSTNTLYGPASIPAGGSASPRTTFTAVSQTGPTGSGTSGDPYKIVTVVALGDSGLQITQTDTYVVGQESYRTDVLIGNPGNSSKSVRLYTAGDCYLQSSDTGYGRIDLTPFGNAVACTVDQTPGSRIEQLYPLTRGSSYMEAYYGTMWAQIGSQAAGPNTCICTTNDDNAELLSWDVSVPAGGSTVVSHLTTFSPLGLAPLSTAKTADSSSTSPGGSDGYTITVHNPNATDVAVNSITDTLPSGFSYVAGSTTGATTSNPTISVQTLTWSGSFSAAAGGDITLHFNVTASTTPGTYYNNAAGDATAVAIAPTGDTAPITVEGNVGDTTPPMCVLSATVVGPPKQIQVTIGDSGSGLASIVVTSSTNANMVVPSFSAGITSPVLVTATKIDPSSGSTVALTVTDVAGNVTRCDPVWPGKKAAHNKAVKRAAAHAKQGHYRRLSR